MEEVILEPEVYSIPYKVRCSLPIGQHILCISMIIMFSVFAYIPMEGILLQELFVKTASICFLIMFLYIWIAIGVLRKHTLEFTNDEIIYTYLFSVKRFKWSEILDVKIYEQKDNVVIKVFRDKSKSRKRFSDLFKRAHIFISREMFAEVDFLRLYVTIINAAKTAPLQVSDQW